MVFKVNDKVKYDVEYSSFTWYGIVTHVTEKSVDILSSDGFKTRVNKKFVNLD
jgi:hypothetical protein